jgi:hypothetical protein
MGNRTARIQNRNNNNQIQANPLVLQNNTQDPFVAALQASIAEAPLPLGWEESVTSKGVTYFIDHVNGVTTYQDPRLSSIVANTPNKKKKKKKEKLPKYKRDLYSKLQILLFKIHQRQNDDGSIQIPVSRENLLQDSFRFISSLDSLTLTRRLFIKFEGEEGLDYGGMSREWFLSLSEAIFDPELNLFRKCASNHYVIHRYSSANEEHLEYFRFVGIILGMAVYHAKLFCAPFAVPFFKKLLDRPIELSDLQYEDPAIFKSAKKIRDSEDISAWALDFSITDRDSEGKTIGVNLKPEEPDLILTNENKQEYLDLLLKYYFHSTDAQINALKEGFYQFVPLEYLKEFEPEELEQLLAGSRDIDINDLKNNTDYGEGFSDSNPVIKLFWEVMMTLSQEELRSFLQFTTGSNKVPIGGFSHLYGSNGPQKFTIIPKKVAGLPTAHSCFNRLDLPSYTEKDKLKKDLLYAITETHGFGLE